MPETLENVDAALRFPQRPSLAKSRRSRLWQRCLLGGISPLRLFGPSVRGAAGILTYHRVANDVGPDPMMLNVSPRRFRQQIAGLLHLGYKPLPLRSLIETHRQQQPFAPRSFAIVFDDGYSDNFRNAWPVLRELHVPATIFLATRYLDSDERFPFDNWSQDAAATARPLSTAECYEMFGAGLIELGSHTHGHTDFRGRPAEFRQDLQRSLDVLRESFGIETPTFSFPFGFTSPELVAVARELGLSCGLTTDCQTLSAHDDPFHWGRFGAIDLDTAWTLAAKLDGWYSTCQNAWRAVRRRDSGPTAADTTTTTTRCPIATR
ncbi:MAG: polysaccharide deacetylase family protein [Planctomycetota bacterium]